VSDTKPAQQLYQPAHVPAEPYTRDPVACQQVEASRHLIKAAADSAHPGRAAVLGAGNCAEIPLAEIAARFEHVTINDVDAAELEKGIAAAHLDDAARAKLDVRVADLTSVTDLLVTSIEELLETVDDPDTAIEAMSRLVDDAPLEGMPLDDKYNLIVASCVLSQLHFGLLHRADAAFERRFPRQEVRLRESVRWTSALYEMARRMEQRFIDDLAARTAPGGLIYLSDSTQMCYIKRTAEGKWETAGTYRMLRSQSITDYLDGRFVAVARDRWNWVVSPPQAEGDVGRLFDVQAVVLRTWRT
jgi:hypothetical protein